MPAFPPAPPEEDARDAHCGVCGSLFHSTEAHVESTGFSDRRGEALSVPEFPPGYDPGEADRLIGRDPHAAQ